MNDNDSILAELKKISAWADMQRKATRWSLVFLAIFIPVIILFAVVMEHRIKKNIYDNGTPAKFTWYDVDRNICLCDVTEAIRIGEELIKTTPLNPNGHSRLGTAYLAAGNIEKAREHYAEASRLFPSEENIALLNAAEARIKQENPQQGVAGYPPQGVGSPER